MSASPEIVPITFGEIPVIRTPEELNEAIGRLALSRTRPYVCRLDLESGLRDGYVAGDATLLAFHLAIINHPSGLEWRKGRVGSIAGPASEDVRMHTDEPRREAVTAVQYHRTMRNCGGVKVVFGEATPLYDDLSHGADMDALLADGLTDSRYAVPDSFKQGEYEEGAILAFSLPRQLHKFVTTRAFRLSETVTFGGYSTQRYREYMEQLR